jgi:hypothetical protein
MVLSEGTTEKIPSGWIMYRGYNDRRKGGNEWTGGKMDV